MNRINVIISGIIAILLGLCTSAQAQENVMCFTSGGSQVACGSRWSEVKNGVNYSCYCNCPYAPTCTPESSSSASSSSSTSGGSLQSALTPVFEKLFDNFFKWALSPSTPSPKQTTQQTAQRDYEAEARYKQQQEEYMAKVTEQLSQAKDAFEKQKSSQLETQKISAVNDFKDRVAKSEATKGIKQANCAARASLDAVKSKIYDFSDFKNPKGDAEQTRSGADFTNINLTECPPVTIDIPEVTAQNPVSFQEQFYEYVKLKADSIKGSVEALKEKKVTNDQVIEEKKLKVEQVKKVIEERKAVKKPVVPNAPPAEEDPLLKEALKTLEAASAELQTAEETDQKMKEELASKEKNITALEKMRSTYDVPPKPATPQQSLNK